MKTKRTQLFSLIATGLLPIFYTGCASLTIPEHPVDLRGEGMARNKGDKYVVSSERDLSGSLKVTGYIPGQGNIRANGSFSGTSSNNAEFEVMDASEGKATELRATNIEQPYRVNISIKATGESDVKEDDEGKGSMDGEEYTLEKDGERWGGTFDRLQGVLANSDLFPKEKVAAGHKWEPEHDLFEDILDAMPEMSGQARGMKPKGIDVQTELEFKGLREYKGESCAVIKINISGEGENPSGPGKMTLDGGGEIYRSLDSYRNLKAKASIRVRVSGRENRGGAKMSLTASMSISINEKEEVTHRAKPVPAEKKEEKTEPSPSNPAEEESK